MVHTLQNSLQIITPCSMDCISQMRCPSAVYDATCLECPSHILVSVKGRPCEQSPLSEWSSYFPIFRDIIRGTLYIKYKIQILHIYWFLLAVNRRCGWLCQRRTVQDICRERACVGSTACGGGRKTRDITARPWLSCSESYNCHE